MRTHRLIENFMLCLILGALSLPIFSQQVVSQNSTATIKQLSIANEISIFQLEPKKALKNKKANQLLSDYDLLSLKADNLASFIASASEDVNLKLPIGSEERVLALKKANIFAPGFKVRKASDPTHPLDIDLGVSYSGKVEGDENSMVTLSFNGKEVIGIISLEGNNYNLGKLKDENLHVIYKEEDLDYSNNFTCHTDDGQKISVNKDKTKHTKSNAVDNCVSVYIETEYDVYQEKGSVTAATNYITSLFAQVSNLYANESINLLLSEVFVWDINDPYVGDSPTVLLNEFMDRLDGDFNGDIAHLINFEQNGGIAYVDALCSPFAYGTSGIDDFYSNLPTYSWSVGILAHEIGHNLGSPHTHACVWNGNNTAIDACDEEGEGCGGVLPTAGTIMSYCHLLNDVGIDFSLGFGPQPGDLIRATVSAASCLTVCGDCEDQGMPCDDGDSCTINDQLNAACSCVGEYTDVDLDGVCAEEDPDDLDPCTPNACPTCTNITITVVLDNLPEETSWEIRGASGDVLINSGSGYGQFPDGSTVRTRLCVSDACYTFVMKDRYGDGLCCGQGEGSYRVTRDDDNTVLASGGEFDEEEATDFCIDSNSMTCSGSCDDGDPCTTDDRYDNDCDCVGTPKQDSDNDGICDDLDSCPDLRNNLIGTSCDDGDPCTTDDRYSSNCDCVGTPKQDSDNDGVCDDIDSCPDLRNDLIGSSCDDGDPCTTDERYTSNCECESTMTVRDNDDDGVCSTLDPNDNDPCIPNSCGDGGCIDVVVSLTLDNYPGETKWKITNSSGQVVLESPRYFNRDKKTTILSEICLSAGCYEFSIRDLYGDGICCKQGDGSYEVKLKSGEVLISGGEFDDSETKQFCTSEESGSCTGSCDDNDPCTTNDKYDAECNCEGTPIADSDNDGICDTEDDCPDLRNSLFGQACNDGDPCTVGETYSEDSCECEGGTFVDQDNDGFCAAEDPDDNDPCNPDNSGSDCSTDISCDTQSFTDFESGLNSWTLGGSDASRARFSQFANSGEYCIRLRDNTNESVMTSQRLSIAHISEIKVEFSYFALSMDNSSEDFWLQLSTDGGETFETVEEWNKNDEFINNRRYTGTSSIAGPFTDRTFIRLRCDASNNADLVFIDDIKIELCQGSSAMVGIPDRDDELDNYLDFKVFPNPVQQNSELKIDIESLTDNSTLTVFDILGKKIISQDVPKKDYYNTTISTSSLESGTYMIKVESENNFKIKKVIIMQ